MWGNSDMSDRYSDDWATKSRDTKRSRQYDDGSVQCSCCGGYFHWDDIEVHHTSYQKDNDTAGVNIFPICGSKQDEGSCHHWVHQQGNWKRDKWDPVWGNHNEAHVVKRLQRGYATGNPDSVWPVFAFPQWPWMTIGVCSAAALVCLAMMTKPVAVKRIAIVAKPVNVRLAPTVAAPKLDKPLQTKTMVTVYEESNGWSRIGDGQWVASNYLRSK
jgi:hypothetical protein